LILSKRGIIFNLKNQNGFEICIYPEEVAALNQTKKLTLN
jgi:hypothetical protein